MPILLKHIFIDVVSYSRKRRKALRRGLTIKLILVSIVECSISELYRSDEIDYYCSTNTPATGSTVRKGPTLFGVDICKEDFSIVGKSHNSQGATFIT